MDICIAPRKDLKFLRFFWSIGASKYDIWLFEELPLYMKIEVIENHEVIYCKDESELCGYFNRFRKIREDRERRNRLSKKIC
ncbi:hypothetical protein [Archaeoglobus sp.]